MKSLACLYRRYQDKILQRNSSGRCRRARLETLEPRHLLATVTWDGGGDGSSWNDPANWDDAGQNRIPAAGDDVTIDFAPGSPFTINLNVDVPAAEALGSFTLNSPQATLAASNRTLTVEGNAEIAGGNIVLTNSTWAGSGTLTNLAGMTVRGNSTIEPLLVQGGTLLIEGAGFGTRLSVGGFTNSGDIIFDNQGVNNGSDLLLTSGSLTNAPSGTITLVENAPRADSIFGDVINEGTLTINNELRLENNDATLTNSGSVTIDAGAAVTFGGNPSINQQAGELGVAGRLDMNNGTFNFNGGTVSGEVRLFASASLNLDESAQGGTFALGGNSELSGDVGLEQTIKIQNFFGTTATLTSTNPAGFTNAGTILIDPISTRSAGLVASGPVRNAPSGVIQTGAEGRARLTADLTNEGSVELQTNTTFAGPLTENSGSFLIGEGVSLDLQAANHVFTQSGGTLDIQGQLEFTNDALEYNGGTIQGTPEIKGGILTINSPNPATFAFTAGDNTLHGTIAEDHTIRVVGRAILDGGTALSNFGDVILDGADAAIGPTLRVDGTFHNLGRLAVRETSGRGATLDAVLQNDGILTLDDGLRVPASGAAHANRGTIALNNATLSFSGDNATFANQDAADGGTIPGLVRGTGTLALATGFSNAGRLAPGNSPGTLTIDGDVALAATSDIAIGIAGRTAGDEFDQIKVTGSAALDGTLTLETSADFAPVSGDRFEILTFGSSSGAFGDVAGLSIAGSNVFTLDESQPDRLALEVGVAVADLAVQSITLPTVATAGEEIAIDYTVSNLEEATTAGNWRDAVYLSQDDLFDPREDLLVGRVEHTGDLDSGATYAETLTAPLPGVVPGDYRVLVVTNSSREVADVNYGNNVLASNSTISIDVEELAFNTPVSRSINAGVPAFFRLNIPLGNDVRLRLNAQPGVVVGGVAFGQIPAPGAGDAININAAIGDQELIITDAFPGSHFIALSGLAGGTYELTAEQIDLEVRAVTPTRFGSSGSKTVTITGSEFEAAADVILINEATAEELAADEVAVLSSRTISATFGDVAPGTYRLEVRQNGQTAAANDTLDVFENLDEPANEQLQYKIVAFENVRPGRDTPVTIEYENTGSTDLSPDLLIFEVENGTVRFPAAEQSEATNQAHLFSASDIGDPTIVAPGERGTISLIVRSDVAATEPVKMSLRRVDPAAPLVDPIGAATPSAPAQVTAASSLQIASLKQASRIGSGSSEPNKLDDLQQRFISIGDFATGIANHIQNKLPAGEFSESDTPPTPDTPRVLKLAIPGFGNINFVGESLLISDRNGKIAAVRNVLSGILVTFGEFAIDFNPDGTIANLFFHFDDPPIEPIIDPVLGLIGFRDNDLSQLRRFLRENGVNVPDPPSARKAEQLFLDLLPVAKVDDLDAALLKEMDVDVSARDAPGAQITKDPQNLLERAIDNLIEPLAEATKNQNGVLGLGFTDKKVAARLGGTEKNTLFMDVGGAQFTVDQRFLPFNRLRSEIESGSGKLNVKDNPNVDVRFSDGEISIRSADGNAFIFSLVEGSDRLELDAVKLANGEVLKAEADESGVIKKLLDSQGNVVFACKNNGGGTTTLSTGDNAKTVDIVKDSDTNQIKKIIRADGREVTVDYRDFDGVPLVQRTTDGTEVTNLEHDEQGRLKAVKDGSGKPKAEYEYLEAGSVSSGIGGDVVIRTPDGKQTFIEQDEDGRVVQARIIDADGQVTILTKRQDILNFLKEIEGAGEVFRQDPLLNVLEELIAEELAEGGREILEALSAAGTKRVQSVPLRELNLKAASEEVATAQSTIVKSDDPNDILGPVGLGPQHHLTKDSLLPYTIRFENKAEATAPAQEVFITQQLDEDLDFTTFELGDVGFGDFTFDIPAGQSFFQGTFDVTGSLGVLVELTAGLDVTTRLASWTFRSLDPITGDLPFDALAGFLPPNVDGGEGDGFVSYTVRAQESVTTGDVIDAQATIVFDTNESLDTPPIFNTIDDGPPTSSMNPLPAEVTGASFTVSWSGEDDAGGSGIATFDIFVSENNGPFELLLDDTTQTSLDFTGEDGKRYGFFSVATDNLGFVEEDLGSEQAFTVVKLNAPPVTDAGGPYVVDEGGTLQLDASGSSDSDQATATLTFAWDLDGDGNFGESGANATRGDETGLAPTFSAANLDGPDSIIVDLRITDDQGLSDTDSATINIRNVAPTISVTNDEITVDAGVTATNTGSFDDVGLDNITLQASVGNVATNGDGTWSWSLETNGPSDAQLVTITASDDDGATTDVHFNLTVLPDSNSAPAITELTTDASRESKSADGRVLIAGTFADADLADSHQVLVDWGDGSEAELLTIANGSGGTGTFSGSHDYAQGGRFLVRATVSDNRGGTHTLSAEAFVVGVGLNNGVLQILGTERPDHVQLNQVGNTLMASGALDRQRFAQTFAADQLQAIEMILCEGGDVLHSPPHLGIPMVVDAGDGNDLIFTGRSDDVIDGGQGRNIIFSRDGDDRITTGDDGDHIWSGKGDDLVRAGHGRNLVFTEEGNDIVVAGQGDDIIYAGLGDDIVSAGDGRDLVYGGLGRNILIGGRGRDDLFGVGSEDILIGGTTIYDDDRDALQAILAEWSRDADYDSRLASLRDGTGLLAAGLQLAPNEAVLDDGAGDLLFGAGSHDWFFASLGATRDWLIGRRSGDRVDAV